MKLPELIMKIGIGLTLGAVATILAPRPDAIAAQDDDPPRRKIYQSPAPVMVSCNPTVHVGDVWVADFYEVAEARGSKPNQVRYAFEVCWQPYAFSNPLPGQNEVCYPPKSPPSQFATLDLAIGIYADPKTAPKCLATPQVSITQFTMTKSGAINTGNMECRTFTTPPQARPVRPVAAPWIRVRPEQAACPGDHIENGKRYNDVREARPDLTVRAKTFEVLSHASGAKKIKQEFQVCNRGGRAASYVLGFSTGHHVSKAKNTGVWADQETYNRGVAAKQCKTVSHTFATELGMFRGFVKVDPEAKIKEASETNNTAVFDYGAVSVSVQTPTQKIPPSAARARRRSKRAKRARNRAARKTPPEAPSQGRDNGGDPPEAPSAGQGGGGDPPEAPSGGQGGGGDPPEAPSAGQGGGGST